MSLLEYKQLASLVLVGETYINLVLGILLVAVEAIATIHCKGVRHVLILKLDSASSMLQSQVVSFLCRFSNIKMVRHQSCQTD